jgi:hypothetical protein
LTRNNFTALVLTLLMTLLLSGCDPVIGGDRTVDVKGDVSPLGQWTREDLRTQPGASPRTVDLGTVGEEWVIDEAGDYVLNGTLAGHITVRAEEQVVHLFLNGVSVTSDKMPALYVESAGKVILTACDGTDNVLADGSSRLTDGLDACIYSVCDVTVNGSGRLAVSGFCNDAFHTRDYLKIAGTSLTVEAKDDGLFGNDGVLITDASVQVQAEGCGIKAAKNGKDAKGNIEIIGSDVSVIAGENGLTASRNICILQSSVSAKGIKNNLKAGGEIYAEEGSLRNG